MSGEKSRPSRRALALGALAVLAVGWVVATDEGDLASLGRCFAMGEGFGYGVIDGHKFDKEYFGHTYTGTLNNLTDIQIWFFGAWERPVLDAMKHGLAAKRPNGDGVVLDVGANVGTHAIFIANHAKTVHAIEPWPTVLKLMTEMVDRNKIENIVFHPVGFAKEEGTLPFHVPPGFNLGWGSFSKSYADDHYKSDVLQLPLVVGDTYLDSKGIERIDLVKIDIEGFEKPALEGLGTMLRRDRPAVFFELNVLNEEGFHDEAELRATFPENYEFFEIKTPKEFVWRFPGNRMLICGNNEVGRYQLLPFDMVFARDGQNLAALPAEAAKDFVQRVDRP